MYGPFNQFYPYPPNYPPTQDNPEVVRLAKAIVKEHKAEKKRKVEEDKKKSEKSKPQTFTLVETWGMILFFSIPVTLGQLWLLNQAHNYLNTIFNVPH